VAENREQQNEDRRHDLGQGDSRKHLVLSSEDRLKEVYLLLHTESTCVLRVDTCHIATWPAPSNFRLESAMTGSRMPRLVCRPPVLHKLI
jgi:hypothetical protein